MACCNVGSTQIALPLSNSKPVVQAASGVWHLGGVLRVLLEEVKLEGQKS